MKAAVYVRVSTDEQATSAETQEAEARRFAARHGWDVVDVYRDVGVSGANFTTRPGLLRMLADLRQRPRPWDALVIQRHDRLGRDAARTSLTLEELHEAGAAVWSYADGARVENDPMGRAMVSLKGVFAELERGLIVERVTEGLRAAAEHGRATGGRCYGYRTALVEGVRRFVIHEPEAAVVRELFEAHRQGVGLRDLAKRLNARGIPAPRTGTGSWSPGAIYEILRRVRYRGVVEYGATHKGYRAGVKVRASSPDRVLSVEAPELQIVADDLWYAAQRDPAPARAPRKGREPRYLLTGYARCAACGGPMQVSRAKRGTVNVPVYLCAWARDRGATVCTSKLRRPVEEVDSTLLGWMQACLLAPGVVAEVLAGVRAEFEALDAQPVAAREAQGREIARAVAQVERLADTIAGAEVRPDALVRRLVEAETRVRELRAAQGATVHAGRVVRAWDAIERATYAHLATLGSWLGGEVTSARAALGALLPSPIRCHVAEVQKGRRRFRLTGEVTVPLDLVAGEVGDGQTEASLERHPESDRRDGCPVAQAGRPRLVLDALPARAA